MAHVSRPLIALLAATVLVFALWIVALKPGGSSPTGGGSSNGGALGQYQAAINAAHGAVQTSAAGNARAGADPTPSATTSAPAVHTRVAVAKATASAKTTTASRAAQARSVVHTKAAATRLSAVQRAIRSHKVVALLFYNPAAPDDQAVRQELGQVPSHGGRVFKLAIPLQEINSYTAITSHVPVNFSPTLVLVAPNGQADEIVGYADPFEISQRVDDALATRR